MYRCNIIFLVVFCTYFVQNGLSKAPTQINILSLTNCADEAVNSPDNLICEAELVSKESGQVFNADVSLPFDIDDSLMYNCKIKKWIDAAWKPLRIPLKGSICNHVHKFLPGVWEKLTKSLNIPSDCPIKAGNYSVKEFTADSSDVNLPVPLLGKYLVSAIVLKNDIPILCKQFEVILSK